MKTAHRLTDRLRNRIVGELHLGHLRPGARLPSIREIASEMDADHRAVADAYRRLEDEGLVELRGRTGAYVAMQERWGGELMEETARWLAAMLVEARKRRVTIPQLPEFVRRCTTNVSVRCACIESNEDSMAALCTELNEDFGVRSTSVFADGGLGNDVPPGRLPAPVREADLLITTSFHAQSVAEIANALGKPMVIASVATELVGVIERRLRVGRLTLIVVDPRFAERFRLVYGPKASRHDAIRVVLASDAQALARLDRLEPVLATRAARRVLPDLDVPLLVPRYPSISAESGRQIAEQLIRLNLEANQPTTPAASNGARESDL